MIPKPPIFLFAFANDRQRALQLEKEERAIRELLQNCHDSRRIEYHSLSATSLDDIYKAFNRFHNRVYLFHYGGHSGQGFLNLIDKKSRAANLAVLMGMQKNLKLVVLNGCANQEQVKELFEHGVKAIIATRSSIEDQKAIHFSIAFYDALKSGKTIDESFKHAAARIKEDYPELEVSFRGIGFERNIKFPWGLFAQKDAALNWQLPNPYEVPEELDYFTEVELTDPNTNKIFIELVFEGMAQLNKKCRILWEDYQDPNSEETNLYNLQEAIYNHFPSVLSIHIRDLFTENAKRKGRLRLKMLKEVYLVLGKLLSSITLASLWKAVINEKTYQPKNSFYIRQEYKEDLKAYFQQTNGESDHFDYIWLLSSICRIFADNESEPSIYEIGSLCLKLSERPDLYAAYQFLEFELKSRLHSNNITSSEVSELCEKTEKYVGLLLHHCAFLIVYQLVSVNDIYVRKLLWVPQVDFIHSKVLLRGVDETIRDQDPLLRKSFTCNHAVIFTKNFRSEEEPLILTPFLIDENAYKLRRKEQPKIYFWAGRTEEGKLWYQHAKVLSDGLELPPKTQNIYRIEDLENIVKLLNQFARDVKLDT